MDMCLLGLFLQRVGQHGGYAMFGKDGILETIQFEPSDF